MLKAEQLVYVKNYFVLNLGNSQWNIEINFLICTK